MVDVLPFSWRELGFEVGDLRSVFNWFVRSHGRMNMLVQAAHRRIEASLINFPTTEELRAWTGEPLIFALVLWKRDWDPARDEKINHGWI